MTVEPRESGHFEFYYEGNDFYIESLYESVLYAEDWIGLKTMDQHGKLTFLHTDGGHLEFSDEWFVEMIMPYLNQ